eukprot:COSAG02_NODE_6701_length_3413_cov_30.264937_1_plen_163_part_00
MPRITGHNATCPFRAETKLISVTDAPTVKSASLDRRLATLPPRVRSPAPTVLLLRPGRTSRPAQVAGTTPRGLVRPQRRPPIGGWAITNCTKRVLVTRVSSYQRIEIHVLLLVHIYAQRRPARACTRRGSNHPSWQQSLETMVAIRNLPLELSNLSSHHREL